MAQLSAGAFIANVFWLAPSQAESLHIRGYYPAPYREASLVESIMVDRFDGNEGTSLAHDVERQLASVMVENVPWFDIVASGASQPVVARMTGVANVGIDEQFYREMRKECVERDASQKCVREEEKPMRCTRRIINLTVSIRLARTDDGRILYSVQKPKRDEVSFCPDRGTVSTPDEVVDGLIKDAARTIRNDVSPFFSSEKVKVLEDRKTMPKDLAQRFKVAVKYTKGTPDAACTLFNEINQQAPGYGAVAYDVALCAEMAGRLAEAEMLYKRAQPMLPGERLVTNGLARIAARRQADADWAERKARRSR